MKLYKTLLIAAAVILLLSSYLFMSANCGMFDSNYKAYYLSKLPSNYVIPFVVVTPSNVNTIVNDIEYPVVLKPDRCNGCGNGVQLVNNKHEALKYLKEQGMDHDNRFIAQKYVEKPHEYSVLYERHPILSKGRVISITEKVPIKKSTSFEPLNVGNIYRKCHIIDHSRHIDDKISELFDEITGGIPDFYVGRYDMLADSLHDLLNGNFAIIELNGLVGVDHRAYVHTIKDLDIRNLHQQLRWYGKRVIIGLQTNLLHNPLVIVKNVLNGKVICGHQALTVGWELSSLMWLIIAIIFLYYYNRG